VLRGCQSLEDVDEEKRCCASLEPSGPEIFTFDEARIIASRYNDQPLSSARVKSSNKSRQCSVPTEIRTKSSVIPPSSSSDGVSSL
jgi:hypothetical protein